MTPNSRFFKRFRLKTHNCLWFLVSIKSISWFVTFSSHCTIQISWAYSSASSGILRCQLGLSDPQINEHYNNHVCCVDMCTCILFSSLYMFIESNRFYVQKSDYMYLVKASVLNQRSKKQATFLGRAPDRNSYRIWVSVSVLTEHTQQINSAFHTAAVSSVVEVVNGMS